ncbi:hypothetical protein PR202_gb17144 [Eleusine coracana subsp. coracana]|uniref:Protein LURP-one-related 15 n=1 Tax=Eleusine coracana subsp. coracana TaxID=191504 RepID=A0AAV5EZX4_ELECO|nr:hypothetical protein PR202_gb17144 [Eleusine coracana subsp. coracana]
MAAPYDGAPSAPPMPAPVTVVSPQFCAPYVVPLTVTKKALSLSDGDFTVTDANGAVVLKVKGSIFSVRHRRVLVDAAGQPILTMTEKVPAVEIFLSFSEKLLLPCFVSIHGFWRRKKQNALIHDQVFSLHNRWEVYRGDSTNASDLLFTAKKASIVQLKTAIDVFLAGNTSEHICDFKIRGSYFERSCAFYLGNSDTMIAQTNRKFTVTNVLLEKDTFTVTVFPHVDYVFIAALVVILDEIHRERLD